MSEEEILNRLSNLGYKYDLDNDDCDAVRKIQDMYKAEKEKNKELKKPKYIMNFETNEITTLTNDFISKDKIKEKIEELKDRKLLLKDEQDYYERSVLDDQIDILEELLEE